jgi:hypothetical protein
MFSVDELSQPDAVFDRMIPFNTLLPTQNSLGAIYLLSCEVEPLFEEPYNLFDLYCPNPNCPCCKVTLVIQDKDNTPVATISYGWKSGSYYQRWGIDKTTARLLAQGFLDPLGPQSQSSQEFLAIARNMIKTKQHFKRMLQHRYQLFKQTVSLYGRQRLKTFLQSLNT